jgi:tellurite resistance protein
MEVIIFLFLIFGGWRLILWLLKVGGGAATDVVKGQATFKEGVQARVKQPTELEMRVISATVSDENISVWKVEVRGLFRIASARNLGLVISLLDVSESGNAHPILSAFEAQQESETRAFQIYNRFGVIQPGQGFLHWQQVGVIPKDSLMFPFSGDREISILARLVDLDEPPQIEHGFCDPDQIGVLQQLVHKEVHCVEKGFVEKSDEELGIAAASVRLGLSVAYSDGKFDPIEGKLIKQWAAKFVNEVPKGQGRDHARAYINDAIRYGNEDAKSKNLSISNQVDVLNKLADRPEKYAAIELCLDVMAADGTANQEELKMVNKLCESLGLDPDRFSEMRDYRMIGIESASIDGANIWEILGIDVAASVESKRDKLKVLYRRWNSRAESLEDATEREKAHEMLDLVAQARTLLNA